MMLPVDIQCSGCGSCAAVCPKNCITMAADREGFRYPVVAESTCVHCGLCEKACPVLKPVPVSEKTAAWAAQNRNEAVRWASSSGGVFSVLAEAVLSGGGAVCGAAYDSHFEVIHALADVPEAAERLRGAKYAQSWAEHCFPAIRERLAAGQPVLFVGTPCQCAGLKAYLGRDDEKLLTVDMICHGVPSPKVWEAYLRERAAGRKISSVNLRSKTTGWSRYGYSVEMSFEDGSVYEAPQGQDLFMQGFVRNLYLRPSCAECSFKGISRCSDLTLGDYWGIWDQHPEFDDDKGTSLLLVHSEKGQQAWESVRDRFRAFPVAVEDALAQNPSADKASPPHPRRASFFRDMEHGSVIRGIQHALGLHKEGMIKRLVRRISRR